MKPRTVSLPFRAIDPTRRVRLIFPKDTAETVVYVHNSVCNSLYTGIYRPDGMFLKVERLIYSN